MPVGHHRIGIKNIESIGAPKNQLSAGKSQRGVFIKLSSLQSIEHIVSTKQKTIGRAVHFKIGKAIEARNPQISFIVGLHTDDVVIGQTILFTKNAKCALS